MQKNKLMIDLILNKQRNKERKISTLMLSIDKRQLRFVKPILLAVVYLVFIVMSFQNEKLFLKEMLVSGGIMAVLYFVHVLSQKE